MKVPQTVEHTSQSCQALRVYWQRSLGDPSGIPHGRPQRSADALFRPLLVPLESASTISASASNYFDVKIFSIIIFNFVGYSPVFGESPVLVNQFVYCRKRLMNKFFQVHLFSIAYTWCNLVNNKRDSVNDTTLNRRRR